MAQTSLSAGPRPHLLFAKAGTFRSGNPTRDVLAKAITGLEMVSFG